MKRINIIGPSGAGKTYLARELSKIYSLPIIHIDAIGLSAKYGVFKDKPAFLKKVKKELESDKWIVEGVFKSTLGYRIPRAELTIYLDYPRRIYYYRVLKRRWQYRSKQREEMPDSWKEKIDRNFFKYVWSFHKNQTPFIKEELAKHPGANIVTIKNPKQLKLFLKTF